MHGSLTLVTAPVVEPVSLSEAKLHLRVDGTDEDTYITALIVAARRWVERTRGLALVEQTWDYAMDRFPRGPAFRIPKVPLQSVTSITYHDEDLSTTTVFSSSLYQVDATKNPPLVVLKNAETWPDDTLRLSSGVVTRFVAGYGDLAADVPEDIQHAIKLLVGQMYTHREPEVTGTVVARIRFAVDALLAPYALEWY